jgi:hypothetical protein
MAGSFQINPFRFAGRVVLTGKREFGEVGSFGRPNPKLRPQL